jgi:hypothetical protein
MNTWIYTADLLVKAAREAGLNGEDRQADGFRKDLANWLKKHPQPGLGDPAVMAELMNVKPVVDTPRRRWFRRDK